MKRDIRLDGKLQLTFSCRADGGELGCTHEESGSGLIGIAAAEIHVQLVAQMMAALAAENRRSILRSKLDGTRFLLSRNDDKGFSQQTPKLQMIETPMHVKIVSS